MSSLGLRHAEVIGIGEPGGPERSGSSVQLLPDKRTSKTDVESAKASHSFAPWFWEGPQHFDGSQFSTASLFAAEKSSATFQLERSFVVAARVQVPNSSVVDSREVGGKLFSTNCAEMWAEFKQPSGKEPCACLIAFRVADGVSNSLVRHKMTREDLGKDEHLDICGVYWSADDATEVRLYVNEKLQQQNDASHLQQTLPFEWPVISQGYKGCILRVRAWPVTKSDVVHVALIDEKFGCLTKTRHGFHTWIFARKLWVKQCHRVLSERYHFDAVLKVLMQLFLFLDLS